MIKACLFLHLVKRYCLKCPGQIPHPSIFSSRLRPLQIHFQCYICHPNTGCIFCKSAEHSILGTDH
uniref:Uncharacterized protein n=1 Tax=Arundo donax TaxID=35708 RepID=A0A0A8XP91_ARUDO